MKKFIYVAFAAVLAVSVNAQCVNTILTGGNGQNGTMFDVVNVSAAPINVTGFEQSWFNAGTSTVEIYTKSGTYFGSETTAGAWTLVGTSTGVAHPTTNVLVPIPAVLSVLVASGATQGFYITGTVLADTVAYTTGVNQLGTVIGTDGTVDVRAGVGKAYPFAGTFGLPTAGRLWNGRVCYAPAGPPTCQLVFSSPTGPGSLQIDNIMCPAAANQDYQIGVAFAAGSFPNGWFFGLDIGVQQLFDQHGPSFQNILWGTLDGNGASTFGPIGGVPSGVQIWAVTAHFSSGFGLNTGSRSPVTYTVP